MSCDRQVESLRVNVFVGVGVNGYLVVIFSTAN